jgi:hypothetical protein
MAADNILKAIPPMGWLALAGGIVAVYVLKKTAETVPVVIDKVSDALDNGAINPTSPNNVAYKSTGTVLGGLVWSIRAKRWAPRSTSGCTLMKIRPLQIGCPARIPRSAM